MGEKAGQRFAIAVGWMRLAGRVSRPRHTADAPNQTRVNLKENLKVLVESVVGQLDQTLTKVTDARGDLEED